MPTEIVRLPVSHGQQEAVLRFLTSAPYFGDAGLRGFRILRATEREEIALVLEWSSREASSAALHSAAGRSLLEGLEQHLDGPPDTAYYEEPQER